MKASSTSPVCATGSTVGVVGWDTSAKQDSILVVNALTMALARTRNPADVIHHSDEGSFSTSLDFAFSAGNRDVTLSFGSTGDSILR